MNLKNLKKVHEDEHVALFRSKEGHECRVSKRGLSEKLRKELSSLPLHAAEGEFIGSQQEPEDFVPGKDYSNAPLPGQTIPVEQPSQQPEEYAAPEQRSQAVGTQSPTAQAPADPNATGDDATDAAMQGNATTGPGGIPLANAQNPEEEISAAQQEKNNKAAAWQSDLANGHITPKTYSDLFHDKGILGKIGTIFGLMISGAGSGLAGQPNALLGLMDKEIERDLEAQKQSKSNAQNYLKILQQQKLNDATIYKYAVENGLTYQEAKLKLQETIFQEAKNHILGVTSHHVSTLVNKLPEGPRKEQAKMTMGVVQQAANAEINLNNRQMAEKEYYDKVNRLKQQAVALPELGTRAKDLESHSIPGVGTTKTEVSDADRTKMAAQQNLLNKTSELREWAQKHSGDIRPNVKAEGETKAKLLQDAYRQANGEGVFKPSENEFIGSIIETHPTKFFNKFRVDPKFKAVEDGINADLDSIKAKYGAEPFGADGAPQSNAAPGGGQKFEAGVEYTDSKGNKATWDGKKFNPSKKK